MHLKHILSALLAVTLFSCHKEAMVIIPTADFSFRGDTSSVLRMATYDTCTLFSNSVNADSSYWDMGNGVTTKGNKAIVTYDSSGTYHVTLTVKSSDGHIASQIKTIKVLDRVLKKIVLSRVYWDTIPGSNLNFNEGWPTTSTADLFVQIQHYRSGDSAVPRSGLLPNSPILYKSPIASNVSSNSTQRIEIPITERVVIDKKMIADWSLVISLLAIDKNGTKYCIQTSQASGGSLIITEDFAASKYTLRYGLFSVFELVCDFE